MNLNENKLLLFAAVVHCLLNILKITRYYQKLMGLITPKNNRTVPALMAMLRINQYGPCYGLKLGKCCWTRPSVNYTEPSKQ